MQAHLSHSSVKHSNPSGKYKFRKQGYVEKEGNASASKWHRLRARQHCLCKTQGLSLVAGQSKLYSPIPCSCGWCSGYGCYVSVHCQPGTPACVKKKRLALLTILSWNRSSWTRTYRRGCWNKSQSQRAHFGLFSFLAHETSKCERNICVRLDGVGWRGSVREGSVSQGDLRMILSWLCWGGVCGRWRCLAFGDQLYMWITAS